MGFRDTAEEELKFINDQLSNTRSALKEAQSKNLLLQMILTNKQSKILLLEEKLASNEEMLTYQATKIKWYENEHGPAIAVC